jgi:hypothetical protein
MRSEGARSNAGRSLPPYYLVYFLLVNLLKFNDLGQSEKVSYSIPVEFNGTILMVELTCPRNSGPARV